MPAPDVAGMRSAAYHDLLRSRCEVKNGDLRSIETTCHGSNCEQDAAAVRQGFRPQMIGFTTRAIWTG